MQEGRSGRTDYEDIIHLPHHVSKVHPSMPVADRAAQFMPFSALTGYEDAIRESGRLTCRKKELGEDARRILDQKLQIIQERAGEGPEITVAFFRPDERKEGGEYRKVSGRVKRIDPYKRVLLMESDIRIALDEICDLEGEMFLDDAAAL